VGFADGNARLTQDDSGDVKHKPIYLKNNEVEFEDEDVYYNINVNVYDQDMNCPESKEKLQWTQENYWTPKAKWKSTIDLTYLRLKYIKKVNSR